MIKSSFHMTFENQSNYKAKHKQKLTIIFSQPWTVNGIHGVIYRFSQSNE